MRVQIDCMNPRTYLTSSRISRIEVLNSDMEEAYQERVLGMAVAAAKNVRKSEGVAGVMSALKVRPQPELEIIPSALRIPERKRCLKACFECEGEVVLGCVPLILRIGRAAVEGRRASPFVPLSAVTPCGTPCRRACGSKMPWRLCYIRGP